MIEIVNDIEITKSGEYQAKVFVDGWEQTFNINAQTFGDDELDDFAEDVMVELREQDNLTFFEQDRTGHKRYHDLKYYSIETWHDLLCEKATRTNVFFRIW